jgi:hypothetical protein
LPKSVAPDPRSGRSHGHENGIPGVIRARPWRQRTGPNIATALHSSL